MSEKRPEQRSDVMRVAFQVYGQVQGVFFRINTIKQAKDWSLTGWVRNSVKDENIVEGEAQGSPKNLELLKKWLSPGGGHPGEVKELRKWQGDLPLIEGEKDFVKKYEKY